ncbi:MAG TPA: DUF2157 domain-containing protein [Dehalococcoidia bacterium]|nr:DUF2157 domain-containing protein [Dehalococcoidia bacterium]
MDDQEYRERLARDLAGWRNAGLITADQEREMLARAGAGEARFLRALRLGWLITAVSVVGALVLGAGVILLFASNWEEMPDWSRTALVFGGMMAAYAGGYALIYRYDMQRIGSALLLLGAVLFEAGLFLLAQIYNMPVASPVLLLLAAIGILPLGYAFGSRIIALAGVVNLTIWAYWELFERYEESPGIFVAFIVLGVLGVAWYAVGRIHGVWQATRRFEEVWVFSGLLVTLSLVYAYTFVEPWETIIEDGVESFAAPPVVYIAILAAGALVAAQAVLRARSVEHVLDISAQAGILVLAAIVATWPAWTGYAVVFNGVFFAVAAGLVTRGYLGGDERYVNAGLLAVGVGVMTRYVDVFWSLLTGSLFFIIGGLLLLAVAFAAERFRRTLLRSMPDDRAGTTGPGAPNQPAPGGVPS